MNILILGGTGAMGTHLCLILAGGENKIFVTSRKNRQNVNGITFVKGNAHNLEFIRSLLKEIRWDAVIDFMTYTTSEFKERIELYLDSTKQYIFLSSSRVYSESSSPILEDSPLILNTCNDLEYLSTDEYALKKARQERILKDTGKNNWTVIRPYVTFSEQRLQLSALEKEYWLYRALKGRTIVFSKDIADKRTTFTYGFDVANGIASLIGKETAYGQAFHITNNEIHTWNEILKYYVDILESILGKRPKVLMLDEWKPFMGGNKYQVKWDRLYDRTFNTNKINKYINTTKFSPTFTALSECINGFIAKPLFKQINWSSEAVKDRLTGEWANISEIKGVRHKLIYYLARLGIYSRYEKTDEWL